MGAFAGVDASGALDGEPASPTLFATSQASPGMPACSHKALLLNQPLLKHQSGSLHGLAS